MGYPAALERKVEETLAKSLRMPVNDLTAFSETHTHAEIMQAYDDAIVMAYAAQDGIEESDTPPAIDFEEEYVSEEETIEPKLETVTVKKKRGRPRKVVLDDGPMYIGPLGQFFE